MISLELRKVQDPYLTIFSFNLYMTLAGFILKKEKGEKPLHVSFINRFSKLLKQECNLISLWSFFYFVFVDQTHQILIFI